MCHHHSHLRRGEPTVRSRHFRLDCLSSRTVRSVPKTAYKIILPYIVSVNFGFVDQTESWLVSYFNEAYVRVIHVRASDLYVSSPNTHIYKRCYNCLVRHEIRLRSWRSVDPVVDFMVNVDNLEVKSGTMWPFSISLKMAILIFWAVEATTCVRVILRLILSCKLAIMLSLRFAYCLVAV